MHIEDPFDRKRNLNDVLWGDGEHQLWIGLKAANDLLSDGEFPERLFSPSGKPALKIQRGWSMVDWQVAEHKDRGHKLPRTRITDELVQGCVLEWKGRYGWLQLDAAIEHEKAKKKDGRVFVSKSDLRGGLSTLRVGDSCRFYLYADESGLGAEECFHV